MRIKETYSISIEPSLISEVERNKDLICINDKLYYVDDSNCQKWIVTELFEGGFTAKDDYEERDFFFCELQLGWTIGNKTKEIHKLYDRFIYM